MVCIRLVKLILLIKNFVSTYGKNKGANQLHGNQAADQRLCFHYIDSPLSLLSKSKI